MSKRKIPAICGFNDGKNKIRLSQNKTILFDSFYILLGDVESNPGPFWKKGEDLLESLQNIIDDQADDLRDLRDTVDDQNETIEDLKSDMKELTERMTKLSEGEDKNKENIVIVEKSMDTFHKESDSRFEDLSEKDSKIGQELLQHKVVKRFKDLSCMDIVAYVIYVTQCHYDIVISVSLT